ncbi:MAG: TraR/DksA family transcriptional regulator [Bacteroidetes bacterium]|nr:TraR/DksA family transcriptional regulator [Bacteroidota bacterium]
MAVILVINKITKFAQNLMEMAKSKKTTNKKAAKPAAKKVSKPAPKAKAKVAAKPAAKKTAKPASKAKPVAKKAAKPAPKKVVKKAAPAKKAAKPAPKKVVKKAAKPAPKKVAPKKAAKPAPKKVVKKAAPAKKVVTPAPKKVVAKPAPAKKEAPKPVAKAAAKPVAAPAKKAEAPVAAPVKPAVGIKSGPVKKHSGKKSSKPVETYDGKRVVRSELPAKALITLQKPEEETRMEHTHYEFPTLRYSDAELKEFKEIIDKKLAAGREELKNLKDSLESHTESQVGNKSWNMEEGSDTSEMEYLMNQIARLNKFIRDLEMALVRIENKTYGICRATGKLIDKNRLRVVPHATLSMEAKMSRKTDDITNTSQAPAAHMGSEGEGFGGEE